MVLRLVNDTSRMYGTISRVTQSRKITVEVPEALLDRAQAAVGEGITSTVRRGLELVAATRSLQELRALRGKIRFTIDLGELREDRG